jgi:hypothetical protein
LANPHSRHAHQPDAVTGVRTNHADVASKQVHAHEAETSRWLTAHAVARHLCVDVSYVYEHAAELGARRLGHGPKARLRFRLDLVDQALLPITSPAVPNKQAARIRPPRRGRRRPNEVATLLPIRHR